MAAKKQKQNNKGKTNPVLWVIFAVIIPVIVVAVLVLFILSFAGFDTFGWAKQAGSSIPGISTMVSSDKGENAEGENNPDQQHDLIAKKDEEIERLKEEISNLEVTVDHLEQDVVKLEKRNENLEEAREANDDQANEENNSIKTAAASFRKMDPGQAAQIMSRLDHDDAVQILTALSSNVRGGILEAMEPEPAASLTELLLADDE